jgi:hypothetical protein
MNLLTYPFHKSFDFKQKFSHILNTSSTRLSANSSENSNKEYVFNGINNNFSEFTGIGQVPLKGSVTPYSSFSPDKHFWKTAVAQRMPTQLVEIYTKKFSLDKTTKIMCAGSCFAQHIGKALKDNGFNFLDYEPPFTKPVALARVSDETFGYNLYSARYGNIYTTRQLRQLFLRAFDRLSPIDDFWLQNGHYYDPYRPSIEPFGYYTLKEAHKMRKSHLAAVKKLFLESELLIFTMGLTECWCNKEDGVVYPVCPGAAAGEYNEEKHKFLNLTYADITYDLHLFISELREVNPKIKLLLTVSPVPLVATASDDHVLVATMKSKAALRTAAAEMRDRYDFVDYFPSYDIISSIPFARGAFSENLRQVKPEVVKFVMAKFLQAHGFSCQTTEAPKAEATAPPGAPAQQTDEICEELLLEAFNK